jgi:hypothetical protein
VSRLLRELQDAGLIEYRFRAEGDRRFLEYSLLDAIKTSERQFTSFLEGEDFAVIGIERRADGMYVHTGSSYLVTRRGSASTRNTPRIERRHDVENDSEFWNAP